MYDVAIIGAGPGGLSTAIYLGRYRRKVVVFDRGKARASFVPVVHNYLGFPDGVSGKELIEKGTRQAGKYGVEFRREEVTKISGEADSFLVETQGGTYQARRLVFASGIMDHHLHIPNYYDYAGKSIFYCPDCDGYEASDKRVVAVGSGNGAAALALVLLTFTDRITVCTNGEPAGMDERFSGRLRDNGIPVVEEKITGIRGSQGQIEAFVLAGGEELPCRCAFVHLGARVHSKLAKDLGVELLPNEHIKTDRAQATNLDGVWAVGDVGASSQQISVAVGQGAIAAIWTNKSLLKENQRVPG